MIYMEVVIDYLNKYLRNMTKVSLRNMENLDEVSNKINKKLNLFGLKHLQTL